MYRVLYHMTCSQWYPLANPGMGCVRVNIPMVAHTRLGTDSPLCHLCTAVHETKWLASTKKPYPPFPAQASLPNLSAGMKRLPL